MVQDVSQLPNAINLYGLYLTVDHKELPNMFKNHDDFNWGRSNV